MVIVDASTHYVALNPVPHCNAYYAYITLYEHFIANIGLPEILVTDNGTEFINFEIVTLCHLNNTKHKPRISRAPWTNGLVESMNRSLQEHLCIISGNDKNTEWSTDGKLFPLTFNSQITKTFGLSPYQMVFNQKPRKPIISTVNSSKMHKDSQPQKDSNFFYFTLSHWQWISFSPSLNLNKYQAQHSQMMFYQVSTVIFHY